MLSFTKFKYKFLLLFCAILMIAAFLTDANWLKTSAQNSPGIDVKINFQPDASIVPAGYVKDAGAAYTAARGYGWVREDSLGSASVPLNISPNSRKRNLNGDLRLDTLLHLQYPPQTNNSTAVKIPAAWEYNLPNGNYTVTVSVGDAGDVFDSAHQINIEGQVVISNFVPTASNKFSSATRTVSVGDGKLTIDAIGGTNTKINYVNIASATSGAEISVAPNELIFSGVKGTTSATQTATLSNTGDSVLTVSNLALTGNNAGAFRLINPPAVPFNIAPNSSVTVNLSFAPGSTTVGALSAVLRITSNDTDEETLDFGLYGLSTKGLQGSNEPPLKQIVDTLGYPINVGSTGLILNPNDPTTANLLGDEVRANLFEKAQPGNITITPIARYSPDEEIPFGFYTLGTNDTDGDPTYNQIAVIAAGEEQMLNPRINAGGANSFDPGNALFGFYAESTAYQGQFQISHTQDQFNSAPTAHRVRVYPLKNRSGQPIMNTYLLGFEPATNGDYQDYVFVVSNVKPGNAPAAPSNLTANYANSKITLNWQDNSGNEDYNRIERSLDGGASWSDFQNLGPNETTTDDIDVDNTIDGIFIATYSYRVRATNVAGSSGYSNVASASVPTNTNSSAVRINAGGSAQTVNGIEWSGCASAGACNGFVSGGFQYTQTPLPMITGAVPPINQAIHQTEWTGGQTNGVPPGAVAFSFNISVPNGNYNVRLHFSELNKNGAGLRLFDVNLEGGAKELTNFDIFAAAGGIHKAIVREFPVSISDGNVTIDFIRQVENAKISAIEIIPSGGGTPTPSGTALFVAGTPTLNSADAAIVERLEQLGFAVVNKTADEAATADASGKQLVVVSSTVLSGAVNTKFRNVAVPVVTWENALFDDFGMTGTNINTDYGTTSNQSQISITNSAHDLAAGRSGVVGISNSAFPLTWGSPNSYAAKIASAPDDVNKTVVFGYTAGAPMFGLNAPARRVGLFFGNDTAAALTTSGAAFFDSAVRWATAKQEWTAAADAPITRVEGPGAVIKGKLYVFGGFYNSGLKASNRVDIYDPAANSWTRLGDMPTFVTHLNPAIDGQTIWFAGGFKGDHPAPATSEVWKYDVTNDSWSRGPDLPDTRGGGALVRFGRTLHYFGGFKADRNTDSADHWTLQLDGGTSWGNAAPLPDARGHLSAAVLDGKIYAIGGQHRHDTNPQDLNIVHAYDPANDTWTRVADLLIPRSHCEPGTFAYNNRIILVGGRSNTSGQAALDQITQYDPITNSWSNLTPLPVRLLAPVAAVINDRLIVTNGGLNNTTPPQKTTRTRPATTIPTVP